MANIVTETAFQNFIKTFKESVFDWDAPWGYKSNGTAITIAEAITNATANSGSAKNKKTNVEPIILATNKDINDMGW